MAWFYLILAGLLEIVWAIGMKRTEGFTKLWPSLGTFAALIASFWLMTISVRTLPIGTAYAIWTGIGAAGTALFGMVFLSEPRELGRVVCLVMIVAGTVGLKLFAKSA
jgi:quaternary ammonium compound-resistance protein SugE